MAAPNWNGTHAHPYLSNHNHAKSDNDVKIEISTKLIMKLRINAYNGADANNGYDNDTLIDDEESSDNEDNEEDQHPFLDPYQNNNEKVALCCNNVQHSRVKHIDVRYHFIKEPVENRILELYFARIEYQLADIFTVPLPRERFNFLIEKLANVPIIYMHQFWATVNKHNASYRFKINNKRELCHSREIKYITYVSVDHLHQPWRAFATIINKCHSGKEDLAYHIDNKDSKKQDKITFMHTARDDSSQGTMRFVSRHKDTQVYGSLFPKDMMKQAILDSNSYKTYYAIATGVEPPKPKRTQKKSNLAISYEETPSKKKPTKAKKDVPSTKKSATKPKLTKKKAPVKADRGKGLNVLLNVALSEEAQLNKGPDEQQRKISGTDEGIGTKPGVLDVPKYDSKSDKESWGDSGEEDDDDENDTKDKSDKDSNDDNGDNDDNDDDDDDNAKAETEEELDDVEELYSDVNMNLRKEDVEMTDVDQGGADQHNVS
nr:retrovirus-related Pol polyprotein from transposon TNT 1-94 [Tanacetum cinerariifolium]